MLSAPSRTERESATTTHHWWNQHVNRRVLHHSSFTAWAASIGILQKTSRHASVIMESHDGLRYGVRPFDARHHVQAYSQLHAQATLLKSLPVPQTNAQWVEAKSMADTRAKQQMLPRPVYKWPWLVRSYLLVEMRHRGINRLTVTIDWTGQEVVAACRPDQCRWLPRWMRALAGDSLTRLIAILKYQEPLELLSCFACVMGDEQLVTLSVDTIVQKLHAIKSCRAKWREEMGWEPNPTLVVAHALGEHVQTPP